MENVKREAITLYDVVPFDKKEHYEHIMKWWGFYYDGDIFPVECLPDSGVVVIHKGQPVAAAFLYKTNAKMAHIHFPIADPSLGAGRRVFFLRHAISAIIEMAKKHLQNDGYIWTCTDNVVVGRMYNDHGLTCPGEADTYFMSLSNGNCEFMK